MKLEGLPQGVEAVRVGRAKPGEFVAWGGFDGSELEIFESDGVETREAQVIVRPAEGYAFRPDPRTCQCAIIELYKTPVVFQCAVRFDAASHYDLSRINDALAALKDLPGYVSSETY